MASVDLASVFAKLASGELSTQEVMILMRGVPGPTMRTSIKGKRTKRSASKAKWTKPIVPVQSWADVQAAFQWALSLNPDNDPWDTFIEARKQYDALTK